VRLDILIGGKDEELQDDDDEKVSDGKREVRHFHPSE